MAGAEFEKTPPFFTAARQRNITGFNGMFIFNTMHYNGADSQRFTGKSIKERQT